MKNKLHSPTEDHLDVNNPPGDDLLALLGKPMKLEPNSCYVIESEEHLSKDAIARLSEQLKFVSETMNLKFILLDGGLKIAREKPDEKAEDE
jgi:hypothetical protein